MPNGQKYKVPENEYETVIFFTAMVASECAPFSKFQILEYVSAEGIDSICSYKINSEDVLKKEVAVEFEYLFSNYFKHGHPIQHTELIICWRIDTKTEMLSKTEHKWLYKFESETEDIRVIELSSIPFCEGIK